MRHPASNPPPWKTFLSIFGKRQPLLFQFKKRTLDVRVTTTTRHIGTFTRVLPTPFGT
jgi:hypothetical protein